MELIQTQTEHEKQKPRTRSLETTPEDQMQAPAVETEPHPLQEPGKEERESATTEEELIREVDRFLTEIRNGANFDDPSLRKGIQLSQGIGGFLQQIDLEAEQAQKPLYRKDGELLLAYKKYAKVKKIPWGRLAKEFFPHINPRSRQNRMFIAQHPELADLGIGFDRGMRFYRAAKKSFPKEKKQMVKEMVQKYDLVRHSENGETLLDFRKRVDEAISDAMGVKIPPPASPKRLVTSLLKWRDKGEDLIGKIRSNPDALGRIGQSNVDSLENQLRGLQTTERS